MPSGVELVVGSRASVSVVDRSLVGSTTTKALLMVDGSLGGSTACKIPERCTLFDPELQPPALQRKAERRQQEPGVHTMRRFDAAATRSTRQP